MAYPNHQHENLLTEIQTKLSTYDPSGYLAAAKYHKRSEDEVLKEDRLDATPQGKYCVLFLETAGGMQEESFSEDFRLYPVTIRWKFMERNSLQADKKTKRISDAIRDIFWRKESGTRYYNCYQVGADDLDPKLSALQLEADGADAKHKGLIHRGQQTWNFHCCIDHQTVDLSTVKSGSVETGERI